MIIYKNTIGRFCENCICDETILSEIQARLCESGMEPSEEEIQSWGRTLEVLRNEVFSFLKSEYDHIAFYMEYVIPEAGKKRIDVVITGNSKDNSPVLILLEMKQWSDGNVSVASAGEPDSNEAAEFLRVRGLDNFQKQPVNQVEEYGRLLNRLDYFSSKGSNAKIIPVVFLFNFSREANIQENKEIISTKRIYSDGFPLISEPSIFFKGEGNLVADLIDSSIASQSETSILEEVDCIGISLNESEIDTIVNLIENCSQLVLSNDQEILASRIVGKVRNIVRKTSISQFLKRDEDESRVMIVQGAPGTGKTIVALYVLGWFLKNYKDRFRRIAYVTKTAEPRDLLRDVIDSMGAGYDVKDRLRSILKTPDNIVSYSSATYDLLLIDEAHRISLGKDKAIDPVEYIAAMIRKSKVTVFFIDDSQTVSLEDCCSIETLKEVASRIYGTGRKLKDHFIITKPLEQQFRCTSRNFMNWLYTIFPYGGYSPKPVKKDFDYDFGICYNLSELKAWIDGKNKNGETARIVAGYTHEWTSRNSRGNGRPEFSDGKCNMTWNKDKRQAREDKDKNTWILRDSSDEVGCIHTIQGMTLDYVGVVIGKDVKKVGDKLLPEPMGRAADDFTIWKKGSGINYAYSDVSEVMAKKRKVLEGYSEEEKARANQIIFNTYRVLMSRGIKGCRIYCEDPSVSNFFEEHCYGK